MDQKLQASGEARVQEILIVPLENIGLAKPSTLTNDRFAEMKIEICQRLAYMSDDALIELRDWVESHPGGKDGDRFPIGVKILKKAFAIAPPNVGPSPLVRKVFSSSLGQEALEQGWAPELLKHITSDRNFPGPWTISRLKSIADTPTRRFAEIERRLSRGGSLSGENAAFLEARLAVLKKVHQILDITSCQAVRISDSTSLLTPKRTPHKLQRGLVFRPTRCIMLRSAGKFRV